MQKFRITISIVLLLISFLMACNKEIIKGEGDSEAPLVKIYDSLMDDFSRDIQPTPDQGFILTNLVQKKDGIDAWIFKTDVNGQIEWQYRLPGHGGEMIGPTADGGLCILKSFRVGLFF